jgi:hypothetical protein
MSKDTTAVTDDVIAAEEAKKPGTRLPGWAFDLAVTLVLFVLASLVGCRHISQSAGRPSFYQEYFAAAVAEGCGMGFTNLNAAAVPAFDEFLKTTRDSVSCADVARAPASPPSFFQIGHRYLMGAIALVWRVRGAVSWSGLAPLFGILFGATVAMGYAIGRIVFGRVLSSAIALALMFSAINLGLMPLLRDYAKAPFFLGTLALLGVMVKGSPKRLVPTALLSLALGAVVGIGLGFRTDLLICVPACVFALVVFMPGPVRKTLAMRLLAAALFTAAFSATGLPLLLRAMKGGGATAHVSLLGMATTFNPALGVDGTYYEWVDRYNDTHVNALVNMYSQWKSNTTAPVVVQTPRYEALAREYFMTVARHFPADMFARACGAVVRVIDLPVTGMPNQFYLDPNEQPLGITDPRMVALYERWHGFLARWLTGVPLLCTLATLTLLAARRLRYALFVTFVILYFGAYTVLQFSLRHTFHLEIIGIWMCAFIAHALFVVARDVRVRRQGGGAVAFDYGRWQPALIYGLVLVLAPAAALVMLRMYQAGHVRELMREYLYAPMTPLKYQVEPGSSSDRVLLRLEGVGEGAGVPAGEVRGDYLVVKLHENHPSSLLIFKDRAIASPAWNQTTMVGVSMPVGRTRNYPSSLSHFFFPAYTGPESVFRGVEIPQNTMPSLEGVYRIDRSSRLPLLLFLSLRSDWESRPAWQRLIGPDLRHRVVAFDDTDPRVLNAAPDEELTPANLAAVGPLASRRGGDVVIHGIVDTRNGDFLHYETRTVWPGAAFVLEGRMAFGCADVMVQASGRYIATTVKEPGPFRVVTQVPDGGNYSVVVANTACPGPNDFVITRAGWVDPPKP